MYEGAGLSTSSSDVAAVVGANASFSCSSNSTSASKIRWDFHTTDLRRVSVYNSDNIPADLTTKYSVTFDESNRQSILLINDIQLSDGGTFYCSTLNFKSKLTFNLVVFGGLIFLYLFKMWMAAASKY
jgi:hypothetical protein